MLTMTVQITGVDEIEKIFARITSPAMPAKIASRIATEVVLPKLAQYPPASRKKQPFVSSQQRKYFFAALKSGAIAVPYRRSGALGKPDNWAQVQAGNTLTLTSNQKHSDLVRGDKKQAKYFKGVWPTVSQVAAACSSDAALVATAVLVEAIGRP
jgi:hypothetical protein